MKNFFLFLVLFCGLQTSNLFAQTEIKANPVALIFGAGAFGIEYGINDDFGLELNTFITSGGGIVWGSVKHYFNPREGLDRFHLGLFVAGSSDLGTGIGFLIGTKILSSKNILFEIGAGLGRSFDDGVLPYGRLSLGYRFGRR